MIWIVLGCCWVSQIRTKPTKNIWGPLLDSISSYYVQCPWKIVSFFQVFRHLNYHILVFFPAYTVWSSSFATLQYSVAQPPVAVGSPTMASSRSLTIAFMLYEAGMLCYSTLSVIYTLKMKSPTPQIRRLTMRKKTRIMFVPTKLLNESS